MPEWLHEERHSYWVERKFKLLRNRSWMNAFPINEARSDCTHNRCTTAEVQPCPQTNEGFDAGAVTCHQILYADIAQSI